MEHPVQVTIPIMIFPATTALLIVQDKAALAGAAVPLLQLCTTGPLAKDECIGVVKEITKISKITLINNNRGFNENFIQSS